MVYSRFFTVGLVIMMGVPTISRAMFGHWLDQPCELPGCGAGSTKKRVEQYAAPSLPMPTRTNCRRESVSIQFVEACLDLANKRGQIGPEYWVMKYFSNEIACFLGSHTNYFWERTGNNFANNKKSINKWLVEVKNHDNQQSQQNSQLFANLAVIIYRWNKAKIDGSKISFDEFLSENG